VSRGRRGLALAAARATVVAGPHAPTARDADGAAHQKTFLASVTLSATCACRRRLGEPLGGLGRYAGPATLILSSLAEAPKHGYALTKDIEAFAGVRLAPGTLYEALTRLERQGLIEALESHDRRRPYRLTATGITALRAHLDDQRRVADVGLRRLAGIQAVT